METLHCEGSTFIDRPVNEVFAFLAHPDVDRAQLTPMEDRIIALNELEGVGARRRVNLKFAARDLEYVACCTEYEPPHRLSSRFEGDLAGTQSWRLDSEGAGTRAHLTLDLVMPQWTPAYLRDDTTADHWGQMLIDQTLANVKTAVEKQSKEK